MSWSLDPSSGEVLPSDWRRVRSHVWRRDSGLCQHIRYDTGLPCLSTGESVDHIVPRSQGGSHGPSNLRVLCSYHHASKTAQEAAQGRRKARSERASAVPTGARGRVLGAVRVPQRADSVPEGPLA